MIAKQSIAVYVLLNVLQITTSGVTETGKYSISMYTSDLFPDDKFLKRCAVDCSLITKKQKSK